MSDYPSRHHPCFFLEDSLKELGADAQVVRDERTLGCWGLIVNGKPMVWLIDNRLPHEAEHEDPAARELLARGVLVCHAQKPDMERVGGHWLPLAATPSMMSLTVQQKASRRTFDAAFVGYIHDLGRSTLLGHLGAYCKLNVQSGVFGEVAAQVYADALCGVNIPSHYGQPYCYDVNMRCMEIPCALTPLVTNWLPVLPELGFVNGHNCYVYRNPDELCQVVHYLQNHPSEAMLAGYDGAMLIRERHLYSHRAKQVLQWLN